MPDSGAPATLDMAGADMEDEELLQAEEITFGLERDLQKALRATLNVGNGTQDFRRRQRTFN